jgi:transmembrane sensor
MTEPPTGPDEPKVQADWEAIGRYLAGQSSSEEARAVRRWLEEHPMDAALLSLLSGPVATAKLAPASDIDVEGALRRIRARRDAPQVVPLAQRMPATAVRMPARWRGTAVAALAAGLVLVVASLLWKGFGRNQGSGTVASVRSFETSVGQRDSVRLPDGTLVQLAPLSRLVVPAAYGKDARQIELQGEAFFTVRHDEAHPFTVRAGDASIRDVGTEFSVRRDSDSVRVLVKSGAVLLRSASRAADKGVVLRPGDLGVLQRDARADVRRVASLDDDLAWTAGRLVFKDAPLSLVASELHRWYGVEVRVADSVVARKHLNATLTGESQENMLRVVALALEARFERRGDTVIVYSARHP